MDHWESIIASIEDPKFGNNTWPQVWQQKFWQGSLLFVFFCETELDTMKEVQGESTVENTSLKSAKTILSTVVNE